MTINGAHVHIGEKGNIDKGPKELVGKTENGAHAQHHDDQAKAHTAALQAKGGNHPDAKFHREAGRAHAMAAHHFKMADTYAEQGNAHAAANNRRVAERHVATAKENNDELAKRNPQETAPKKQTKAEMPDSHRALHADAGDDVQGSQTHETEHNRLVGEYHKAGADWQRHAINNQISKNASAAMSAKADRAHKAAVNASKDAHESDDIQDHKVARMAIDLAREAHEKAGNRSDDNREDKIKELDKMRVPHHKKILADKKAKEKKAEKAAEKAAAAPVNHDQHNEHTNIEDAAEDIKRRRADLEAKGFKHVESVGNSLAKGGRKHLYEHPDGRKAMVRHQMVDAMGRPNRNVVDTSGDHSKKSGTMERLADRQNMLREQGSPRYTGRGANSALGKMMIKRAQKAAEEAADQDPKHKKPR